MHEGEGKEGESSGSSCVREEERGEREREKREEREERESSGFRILQVPYTRRGNGRRKKKY